MRPELAGKAFTRGRRLAKRPRDVQQGGGVFPALAAGRKYRKSHRIPAALPVFQWPRKPSSEPLRTAVVPALAVAVAAVHAALVAVVPPAVAAAKPVLHMGQDLEAALLAVVQRLVERIGRIRDLLQRRGGGRHVVGAIAQ